MKDIKPVIPQEEKEMVEDISKWLKDELKIECNQYFTEGV
jgi:hypothetical protein